MVYDGIIDTIIYPDNRYLTNMIRAVVERVFLTSSFEVVPDPTPGIFEKMSHISDRVAQLVGRQFPRSRVDFVGAYSGQKRVVYQRALNTFVVDPIIKLIDALVKCFVKVEKMNLSTKDDPACRLISPKSPRFNIELGRYLKFVEHKIYDAIGKLCGGTTVAKGLNAARRGRLIHNKWRKFTHPVAVGLDASRFDQHVSADALRYEHSLYLKLFNNCALLASLLMHQITYSVVGYAKDGKLRFQKVGGRCSGDVNTALGNCFLSCSLMYQYCLEKGLKPVFINDGDDTVLFIEKEELPKLDDLAMWFREYGFTMKVEKPVEVIEEIEFCQCHPVMDNEGKYTMIRNLRKALECDLVSNKVRTPLEAKQHCAAIREAGLALNSGIPVMQAFYESLPACKTSFKLPEYGFSMLVKGMISKSRPITPESRLSFYLAFKVTPDAQVLMEQYFCRKISLGITNISSNIPRPSKSVRYHLLKYF